MKVAVFAILRRKQLCKTSVWRSSTTVNIVPWSRLLYWNFFFPIRITRIIRKFVCYTCFFSTKGRNSIGASTPCVVPHGNSSLMKHNCLSSLPVRRSSRAFYTLQELENGEQDQRAMAAAPLPQFTQQPLVCIKPSSCIFCCAFPEISKLL